LVDCPAPNVSWDVPAMTSSSPRGFWKPHRACAGRTWPCAHGRARIGAVDFETGMHTLERIRVVVDGQVVESDGKH
jgi:hypothetical protein